MSAAVHRDRLGEDLRGASGLVVAAASFGGITASRTLLAALPADFPWPIVLVQHRSGTPDLLAEVLARHSALRVVRARPGEPPEAGAVHVADAATQLVLRADGSFDHVPGGGPCSADPLLASAAAVHGAALLAVVLTGRLHDGSRGVVAVKAAGGRVLAQDRATSAAFAMPAAAIATGCVDFVLPLPSLAPALTTLAMLPAAGELFRVSRPPWALPAA